MSPGNLSPRVVDWSMKLVGVVFAAGVAWGVARTTSSERLAALDRAKLNVDRFVLDSARRATRDTLLIEQLREIRGLQQQTLEEQKLIIRSLCSTRMGGCQ